MKNIGILASKDPVAIDRACLDIIYNSEYDENGEVLGTRASKEQFCIKKRL